LGPQDILQDVQQSLQFVIADQQARPQLSVFADHAQSHILGLDLLCYCQNGV